MATYVFSDGELSIGAVDVARVKDITLEVQQDAVEVTEMGDTWRQKLAGLLSFSGSFSANQDFAAANTDAILWAAIAGTPAQRRPTLAIKAVDAANPSATNPEYSGPVIITNYTAIQGTVGDAGMANATFDGAGELTRY